MGVTVTRSPPRRFDPAAVAALVGVEMIGHIQRRTGKGQDVNGRPFAGYAPSYARTRARAGRNPAPVDLTMSGGLLASLHVLRVEVESALRCVVVIGPGTASSPRVVPSRRPRGSKAKPTGRRAGYSAVPQNVVGYLLQHGTKHAPPRRWLGATPEFRRSLLRLLVKRGLIR